MLTGGTAGQKTTNGLGSNLQIRVHKLRVTGTNGGVRAGLMKALIREIHRRSLWQVLGIYLAGSWVALQVVEQLAEAASLPACTT